MGFRQNNKNLETAWRRKARPQLLAAGLPDFVVNDERRWNYVLLHGDDLESGWSPLWITKGQAGELIRLISLHYVNRNGLELFQALEKRIDGKLPV